MTIQQTSGAAHSALPSPCGASLGHALIRSLAAAKPNAPPRVFSSRSSTEVTPPAASCISSMLSEVPKHQPMVRPARSNHRQNSGRNSPSGNSSAIFPAMFTNAPSPTAFLSVSTEIISANGISSSLGCGSLPMSSCASEGPVNSPTPARYISRSSVPMLPRFLIRRPLPSYRQHLRSVQTRRRFPRPSRPANGISR